MIKYISEQYIVLVFMILPAHFIWFLSTETLVNVVFFCVFLFFVFFFLLLLLLLFLLLFFFVFCFCFFVFVFLLEND